jgi:hypothetical protein
MKCRFPQDIFMVGSGSECDLRVTLANGDFGQFLRVKSRCAGAS